ncbi:MAG: hypothetical protein FVQ83_05135, partial [Chloroflexi bacterium]|nr:hypothetical protein [Chloroflexota bacterium]
MYSKKKNQIRGALLFTMLALSLSGCKLPGSGGTGGGGGGSTPTPDPCSVQYLIDALNAATANGPGTDTIDLVPGCIYELETVHNTLDGNNGLPFINTSIIINGNGATIRRSPAADKSAIRLLHVHIDGTLVLNDITLMDGLAMEPFNVLDPIRNAGGAIYNAGHLTINNSLITDNNARRQGGGIYNAAGGDMTINASTIQNNEVTLDNEADESGGGIANEGTIIILDSTISGNVAAESGGGISNGIAGLVAISNSTISGNATTFTGSYGGAAISNAGTLEMSFTTITNNSGAGPGLAFSSAPTFSIRNSIIAGNPGGDCSYVPTSSSGLYDVNLDGDGTCIGFTLTGDPQFDPLANNGGPTQTHAISGGSPAKNAATGTFPATDQRGEPRPHGPASDLGSYEFTGGGPPPPADTDTPTPTVTTFPPTWTPTFTSLPPTATFTPTPVLPTAT